MTTPSICHLNQLPRRDVTKIYHFNRQQDQMVLQLRSNFKIYIMLMVNSCGSLKKKGNTPIHFKAGILVQFNSVAQSCLTLCDPMDCSTPGFPVHRQLPELARTHVHRVELKSFFTQRTVYLVQLLFKQHLSIHGFLI